MEGRAGREGRREGREREGMEEGSGLTDEMGGTGHDMGWDGEEGDGKGGDRGLYLQTSIPGAATAYNTNPVW